MSVPRRVLAALMLACASQASAQGQHTLPPDLAAPGSPILVPKVGGSAFGEGVVADWEGNVYSNELYVSPRRTMRLAVGDDTSKPWRKVGDNPNGLWLDSKNRILICQTQAIVRVKPGATFDDQTDTLYNYPSGGEAFNDITGDSKDNLYFSNFMGGSVFFRDAESGKTKEVLSNQPKPNGLEWDEERKRLYLNENGAGALAVYTVNADYSLASRTAFAEIQGPDGITLDERGNIYAVAFGNGVRVFNPEGQLLGNIPLAGSQLTNLAFGGADFRTLFMITNRGLYRLPMLVQGHKSGPYPVSLRRAVLASPAGRKKRSLVFSNGILTARPPGSGIPLVDFIGRAATLEGR